MLERTSPESKSPEQSTVATSGYTQVIDLLSSAGSYFYPPKYDTQIVLSLFDDSSTPYSLKKKAQATGLTTHSIPWQGSDFSALRLATASTRIYLEGHCAPGETALHSKIRSDKNDIPKTTDDTVALLLKSAPQLRTLTSDSKRIKISVLGCHSAVDGRDGGASYCKQLSRQLESHGIFAIVQGYNGKFKMGQIERNGHGYKICKLINGEHQPTGYKSIFTKGHEVIYEPSLLTSIKQFF